MFRGYSEMSRKTFRKKYRQLLLQIIKNGVNYLLVSIPLDCFLDTMNKGKCHSCRKYVTMCEIC